ncbi:MAG: Gfo/Idh/MocA family oxidoreductase [Spirochaetales bacterium]|nr:Gfo/Idh/MocA family oxidoreductase [Spirochaetales bacterium]
MAEKIKIGVLGISGHFQLRVVTGLNNSDVLEVYAVASRNIEKAKSFAQKWNIPVFYGSYQELLNDPDIDFIYNPLPNNLHAEWIKKAADAGKAILSEKPAALNSKEAEEAILYAKEKKVPVMEAFMYKFHPQWIRAKDIVKSGEIGKIKKIDIFFSYNNNDASNIRNKPETGGGALMDIGCYAISVSRFLLDAEPEKVLMFSERDPDFKIDTFAIGTLDFGDTKSTFTIGTQMFPAQKVEVLGTKGRLVIPIPFNMYADVPAEIQVWMGIGERTINCGPVDQYTAEFEAFGKAVAEGRSVPVAPEDAINNMKVIDALFASEKSGTWAEV